MQRDIKQYKDLTGLLLGPIRERPGMFLGEAKISSLPNFILGYSVGSYMTDSKATEDKYFGEDGFLEWFFKKYNIQWTATWQQPFLDEAKGDEKKALELYFEYLDTYAKSV